MKTKVPKNRIYLIRSKFWTQNTPSKAIFYDLNNKQTLIWLYNRRKSQFMMIKWNICICRFIANISFKKMHCKYKRNFKCKLLQLFIDLVGCLYRKDFTNLTLNWEQLASFNGLVKEVLRTSRATRPFPPSIELLRYFKLLAHKYSIKLSSKDT